GSGDKCTYVGGHTKIGELMAKAVTSATILAIKKHLGMAG
ncbi:MAG: adenosylcobinamide amidohydrolase, partial [Dehalococcoidales bacterium]|nr:adenosylcobinamide amidohydrolase [Dehalococcoidales bacterium]